MILYEPYVTKNGKDGVRIYSDKGYNLKSNTTNAVYKEVRMLSANAENEYFTELVDEPIEIEEVPTEESIPESEKKYVLTEEQYELFMGKLQAVESQSYLSQLPQQNDNESIRLLKLLLGVD